MPMKHFIAFALFICVLSITKIHAQAVGGSAMYNFQSESFGIGGRYSFMTDERFSFVPQISFYPPFGFNKVHEATIGLSIEYKYFRTNKLDFYVLEHGGYNYWINYKDSPMKDAHAHNWNLEGGLGLSWKVSNTWRPFVEYRYNLRFKETHLEVGVLYLLHSNKKKRGAVDCPTPTNIKPTKMYESPVK
jgi:hypothetical protein